MILNISEPVSHCKEECSRWVEILRLHYLLRISVVRHDRTFRIGVGACSIHGLLVHVGHAQCNGAKPILRLSWDHLQDMFVVCCFVLAIKVSMLFEICFSSLRASIQGFVLDVDTHTPEIPWMLRGLFIVNVMLALVTAPVLHRQMSVESRLENAFTAYVTHLINNSLTIDN